MTKINVEGFMKALDTRALRGEDDMKSFFKGAEASLEIMIGMFEFPPESYVELLNAIQEKQGT